MTDSLPVRRYTHCTTSPYLLIHVGIWKKYNTNVSKLILIFFNTTTLDMGGYY